MNKTNPKNCILIIHKNDHATASSLAHEIATWLLSCDYNPQIVPSASNYDYKSYQPNFVIVLGGDGSMVEVSRHFIVKPTPIMGINFGRVGFLTTVNSTHWKEFIQKHLDHETIVHKQMALKWEIINNDTIVNSGNAVNDVVISRGTLSRVVTFNISTEQQEICSLRADGLIISSPIGVTGYAVSAGGPLIHPDLNVLTITPICPFLCNFPSLILPYSTKIKASVVLPSTETYVTIDGQIGFPLGQSEFVRVEGVEAGIHFIKNAKDNYFSRLKTRGFIEEHNPHKKECNEIKK